MKAVYYRDLETGRCPAKEYLRRFTVGPRDKEREKSKKQKMQSDIYAKIDYLLGEPHRDAPFTSSLHGHGYSELKVRKDQKTLIRILYFRYKDHLILLNAFEKPDHYGNDKKVHRSIERELEKTDTYLERFMKNSESIEPYETPYPPYEE